MEQSTKKKSFFLISQALMEVEKYLSLPIISLVDATQKTSGEVRLKMMRVLLD